MPRRKGAGKYQLSSETMSFEISTGWILLILPCAFRSGTKLAPDFFTSGSQSGKKNPYCARGSAWFWVRISTFWLAFMTSRLASQVVPVWVYRSHSPSLPGIGVHLSHQSAFLVSLGVGAYPDWLGGTLRTASHRELRLIVG